MSKMLWQALKVAPAVLGVSLLFANSSVAAETKSKISRETRNENLLAQTVNSSQGNSSPILEQIERYNQDAQNGQCQIVNVFQLTDVSPGDWAFEALRSLVERYGCIVGYPDRTFRGNRALTRWEFAAGLNACLNQIERLIASSEAVLREDIDRLRRLLEEFQAELAALGVRVDDLEGRVAFLEDHQFSTTTKLRGEVIASFNIANGDSASGGPNDGGTADPGFDTRAQYRQRSSGARFSVLDDEFSRGAVNASNAISALTPGLGGLNVFRTADAAPDNIQDRAVLSQRTRLNLDTSFTGRDRLRTRLQARNVTRYDIASGVDTARLGYDGSSDAGNNDIRLGKLWYRSPLPFVDGLTIHLGLQDVDFDDLSNPMNPFFESSGTGALSRFGRFNPAIYRTGGSQSIALNWDANDWFGIDVAYLTNGAADPSAKDGIANGDYTGIIQFNFEPTENLELSVTYGRSYYPSPDATSSSGSYRSDVSIAEELNLSGSTGTRDARNPFAYYRIEQIGGAVTGVSAGAPTALQLVEDVPASANRVGLQASYRATDRFNVGGWFGWVQGIAEGNPLNNTLLGVNAAVPVGNRAAARRALGADFSRGDTQNIFNGAVHFAFLDLGIEGSVLGLISGVAPYTPDRSTLSGATDVPIFVEGQYRIPIGTRFVITPGAYAVFNPNQNSDNDTVVVGSIRTTFKF